MKAPKKRYKQLEIRIQEVEMFFNSIPTPTAPMQLAQGETIVDMEKMISSHLKTIESYNGNPACIPYLNRLEKLRKLTEYKPTHKIT